jgi:hypothetical protein
MKIHSAILELLQTSKKKTKKLNSVACSPQANYPQKLALASLTSGGRSVGKPVNEEKNLAKLAATSCKFSSTLTHSLTHSLMELSPS